MQKYIHIGYCLLHAPYKSTVSIIRHYFDWWWLAFCSIQYLKFTNHRATTQRKQKYSRNNLREHPHFFLTCHEQLPPVLTVSVTPNKLGFPCGCCSYTNRTVNSRWNAMLMPDHPSLVFPAGAERMRSYLREPDIPRGNQSLGECSLSTEPLSPLISGTVFLRFETILHYSLFPRCQVFIKKWWLMLIEINVRTYILERHCFLLLQHYA